MVAFWLGLGWVVTCVFVTTLVNVMWRAPAMIDVVLGLRRRSLAGEVPGTRTHTKAPKILSPIPHRALSSLGQKCVMGRTSLPTLVAPNSPNVPVNAHELANVQGM